jgi:hypothetical protein
VKRYAPHRVFDGVCRERLASLTRHTLTVQSGREVLGLVYHVGPLHASLRLVRPMAGLPGVEWTPAMAAGITDHGWTVRERLSFHGPPPRWRTTAAARASLTCPASADIAGVCIVTTVN